MATKDAGDELDDLYNYTLGGTNPAGSASASGDISQLIKWLVATITGTTDISGITADAAGSIVERIKYITDNTGIGLKKVANAGYAQLPASGSAPVSVVSGAGSYTDGSYAQMRSASGNALYIVGYDYQAPSAAGRNGTLTIATGGSGSETAVSELPLNSTASASRPLVMLPPTGYIAVAASTRIAAKAKDSYDGSVTQDYSVRLWVIDQANVVPA